MVGFVLLSCSTFVMPLALARAMVGFVLLVLTCLSCCIVYPLHQVWQCNFDDEGKRTVPTLIATLSEHEGEVTALSLHAEKNIAVSSGNVGEEQAP